MASFELPNVEGLTSIEELKNAVGKMTKELSWLLNNLDWKNVNELNIGLDNGAFIRISNDGITINDGNMITFQADVNGKVTMTGALIQSKTGYPKIVIDPDNELFGAYASESSYINITPTGSPAGSPQLLINGGGESMLLYQQSTSSLISATGNLTINSSRDINFVPGSPAGRVWVLFDSFFDFNSNTSLYQQLLGKASKGAATSSAGPYNCGIPIGTQFKDVNGQVWTWQGVPAHSHTQS